MAFQSASRRPGQGNNPSTNSSSNESTEGWGDDGRVGFAKSKAIQESRGNGGELIPFPFLLDNGEEEDVIILDGGEEELFFAHEHYIHGAPKGKKNALCCREFEPCPLCAQGHKSPYVLKLTVIVPGEYTDSKGNTHPFKRRLMTVKPEQHGIFQKLLEQNGGSFRGVHLLMVRGKESTAASIGTPMFQAKLTEQDIIESFPSPEVKNDKGEVVRQAGAMLKPLNYRKAFPKPSALALRAGYGGIATPGSDEANGSFGKNRSANNWSKDSGGGEQQVDTGSDDIPY